MVHSPTGGGGATAIQGRPTTNPPVLSLSSITRLH